MSEVNYLHRLINKHIEDNKRIISEEFIIHGAKGFIAKYYHKDNTQEIGFNITKNKNNDKYIIKTKIVDIINIKTLSKADLIKELSIQKELKFITDYLLKN